jgi:uncharacterized membrane protein
MLIAFPLGLLGGSIIFDIVYLITRSGRWADITFWMIAAGAVSGEIHPYTSAARLRNGKLSYSPANRRNAVPWDHYVTT